jgi:hypothetical protein
MAVGVAGTDLPVSAMDEDFDVVTPGNIPPCLSGLGLSGVEGSGTFVALTDDGPTLAASRGDVNW